MTREMSVYAASSFVTVRLPNNIGEVRIQPIHSSSIKVTSQSLLLEPNLYSFQAVMHKANDRWYFYNKAELGVPGARPSPKKTLAALDMIATELNRILAEDEQFKAKITEIQEKEAIREIERAQYALKSERADLQRRLEDRIVNIEYKRRAVEDAEKMLVEIQEEIETFDREHPEVRRTISGA